MVRFSVWLCISVELSFWFRLARFFLLMLTNTNSLHSSCILVIFYSVPEFHIFDHTGKGVYKLHQPVRFTVLVSFDFFVTAETPNSDATFVSCVIHFSSHFLYYDKKTCCGGCCVNCCAEGNPCCGKGCCKVPFHLFPFDQGNTNSAEEVGKILKKPKRYVT